MEFGKLSSLEKVSIRRKILYVKRSILNIFENCASNRNWDQFTAGYAANSIRLFLEQIENIEYTIISGLKKFTVDIFFKDSSGKVITAHIEAKF